MTEPASPRRIVCVGASAGGVEALQHLVAALPPDLTAPLLVVLHVPPTGMSVLPQILSRAGRLPAAHARQGERLEEGRVYVAPPNMHLRVADGRVRLASGPRENGHRPAVDPLFRSAARAYGSDVIGVILSGSLDDGTLGLAAVKAAGGLTVVQDPEEATYTGMPRSAIERVGVHHVLEVAEIAELIATTDRSPDGGGADARGEAMEAQEPDVPPIVEHRDGEGVVSRYTCPECSGTLWEIDERGLVKLRCRVGHTYTEEAYAAAKAQSLEAALWAALQTLEEKADFSRRLAVRFGHEGHELTARRYEEQRANAIEQAELVRSAIDRLDLSQPSLDDERQAS